MYKRVSVIGVEITTDKQACQNLSLAAPLVFLATSRHCRAEIRQCVCPPPPPPPPRNHYVQFSPKHRVKTKKRFSRLPTSNVPPKILTARFATWYGGPTSRDGVLLYVRALPPSRLGFASFGTAPLVLSTKSLSILRIID